MNGKLIEALAHYSKIDNVNSRDCGDQHWSGDLENCDVCSRPMEGELYMIDGPASFQSNPRWGNLCVVCAFKYAPIIAYGKAQLYRKSAEGSWKLIAGGSPLG